MSACIEWTGAHTRRGYGQRGGLYGDRMGTRYVHRQAWIEAHGPIPDGLFVLHRCDNPPCYNVDHLFLGTHQDNADDRVAKGRSASQAGEQNPRSKLTADDVRAIRRMYAEGGWTHRSLAARFGVSHLVTGRILRGQLWTTVN